jgi:hypothetical protein
MGLPLFILLEKERKQILSLELYRTGSAFINSFIYYII